MTESAFGVSKRFYSAQQRRDLEAKGETRPGGRFPIATAADVRSASHLLGHASPADKAFIRRRAKKLGAPIPPSLEDDVAKSAFGVDFSKAEHRLEAGDMRQFSGRRRALDAAAKGRHSAGSAPRTPFLLSVPKHADDKTTKVLRRVKLGVNRALANPTIYRGAQLILKADKDNDLPGDNAQARAARQRKRTGLGTATVGYLTATRAKEMAPHIAETANKATLHAGKLDEAAREAKSAKRIARISRFGSRAGTVLTGAGLALAGEGLVDDLRYRGSFGRMKRKVTGDVTKSAFGVDLAKAYTAGEITYHQQQADMHARKKASAARGVTAGLATTGAAGVVEAVRRHPKVQWHLATGSVRTGRDLVGASRYAAPAVAGAGLALAGGSAARRMYHASRQNSETRKAQQARVRRNASVGKSAFGVDFGKADDSRHPVAGTAAVLAASGAGVRSYKLRQAARRVTRAAGDVDEKAQLHVRVARSMAEDSVKDARRGMPHWAAANAKGAAKSARIAQTSGDTARRLTARAARLTRGSRRAALAATAGGAVGAALLAHRRQVSKSAFGVDFGKAYDPEQRRHGRQAIASGAAAGGSVVAGAGAAHLAREARTTQAESNTAAGNAVTEQLGLHRDLHRMAQPHPNGTKVADMERTAAAATTGHRKAMTATKEAVELARKAKGLRLKAVGAGVGAAGLAASAFGIHHHDTRGGGRSYAY